MKRLVVTLLALLLISPAAVFAQDAAGPDIAAIADRVVSVDSERLLMRLNSPIPAELLPQPFSDPKPLAASPLAEQRGRYDEVLEGIRGSAIYTVEYMPASATASPSPGASPAASPASPRGPVTVFTSATLTYVLFADPIDTGDLEALGATLQQALGTEAQAGTVEQVTVNDAPALHLSTVTVVNALDFHTEWIAIPVGSVIVIAMITEGSDTFDEERFRAHNQELALAGVSYLQLIVEEMGVG